MIDAYRLGMDFGPLTALDDATFHVAQGEIVGLLGPNGAGKSTIMKILTTYLRPTRGKTSVCGFDAEDSPLLVRQKIGYLPENLPLYPQMEVGEYLDFVARARGVHGARLRERLEWALLATGLLPMFHRPIGELSKGYRQRTALAQALVHDPEVIILDEPTTGLDPHQILEIRALITSLAATKTVLFSTHILQEVEAIADRVIIISHGRIRAQGTLEELCAQADVTPSAQVEVHAAEAAVRSVLESFGAVIKHAELDAQGWQQLRFTAANPRWILERFAAACADQRWPLRELTLPRHSLEEVFLALTRAGHAEDGGTHA